MLQDWSAEKRDTNEENGAWAGSSFETRAHGQAQIEEATWTGHDTSSKKGERRCPHDNGYKHQQRTDVLHTFESKNQFKALEIEDEDESYDDNIKIYKSTNIEEKALVVKHRWNKMSKTRRNSINTLVEILPAGVNTMEELQEWEEIEMAVDSGAT